MGDATIEDLVEAFLARRLEGGAETIDEFAAAHPKHADVLKRRLEQLESLAVLSSRGSERKFDVPERFDGFELVRELGRGGMGVVFEARQAALGRVVAIKVISGGGALSARLRERFEREITTLARISHPNIVKVFGTGTVAGAPYVAMELVEGEPLSQRLPPAGERRTRAQIDQLVRIAERAARALAHVHELGVVHRDVKPANVLIDARGEPVLLDFGLARDDEHDSVTRTGEFVGTLAYTAPEQARGERVDRRADVYGLGATLYHLATGSPPYRARSLTDLVRQVESGPPSSASRLNPSLPRDLVTVLEHATQPDPVHRYASCADFADDLARFREGVPVHARAVSTWSLVRRVARRHRTLLFAALAAALALVAGLIAVTRQMRETQREVVRVRLQREWSESAFETAVTHLEPARRAQLLTSAEELARTMFAAEPDLLANALDMLARLRGQLADARSARALAIEARTGREALRDPSHDDLLESKFTLAVLAQGEEDYAGASVLYEEIERVYADAGEPDDERALVCRFSRGACVVALGRIEEGIALIESARERAQIVLGNGHEIVLQASNELAFALLRGGQREPACALLEWVVETRQRRDGFADSKSLAVMTNLAVAYRDEERWEPAMALLQRVVDARTATLTLDHPDRLLALYNLAATASLYGQFGRAEGALAELRELRDRRDGCFARDTLETLLVSAGNQARNAHARRADPMLFDAGLARAEGYLDEILERMRAIGTPASDVFRAGVLRDRAQILQMREHWDESEAPLLEAWSVLGPDEPVCRSVIGNLAAHWDAHDRSDDALRLYELLDGRR